MNSTSIKCLQLYRGFIPLGIFRGCNTSHEYLYSGHYTLKSRIVRRSGIAGVYRNPSPKLAPVLPTLV